jgi:aminopeptidase N
MHVPVRLGFLGKDGRALRLMLEGESNIGPDERVLELTEAEQQFAFVDVPEEPLLSIGRGFSAPVIFKTPLNRQARATLMSHDAESFGRWEAGQALATEILLELADQAKAGGELKVDAAYLDAIGEVLARAEDDPEFAAQMLLLPLESEVALALVPADPDAIHAACRALIRAVTAVHGVRFEALYQKFASDAVYSPDAVSAGPRSLRNASLHYLTAADDEAAARIATAHYRSASNMTDVIAGIAALSRVDSPLRAEAFAHFHDRFRNDPLVLDKWFGLQAQSPLPDTVESVRRLMRHSAFDLKNPNRVRALIGSFAGNHLRFHARDGKGYALVAEVIRALDAVNPRVAARIAGAFENWRRYDDARQVLMCAEMETTLKMVGLSSNLFEVMTKMLG